MPGLWVLLVSADNTTSVYQLGSEELLECADSSCSVFQVRLGLCRSLIPLSS